MTAATKDRILWRHLRDLPYFRAMLRAVEDSFYQDLKLEAPILDLGCGDGHFASVAFSHPLDVGLDPWHEALHEADARGGLNRAIRKRDHGQGPAAPVQYDGPGILQSPIGEISQIHAVGEEETRGKAQQNENG